jgi:hypothetical protein
MKHCPECNKNYADTTLSYCLIDGTPLIFGSAKREQETALLPADAFGESDTRLFEPAPSSERTGEQAASGRRSIALAAAAVLLVAGIAVGGYL